MNTSLLFLFGTAFVVGFSGALAPGPVLTATVGETIRRGFWAGPLIVLGHALLEIVLLVAVIAGLGLWLARPVVQGALGVSGGLLLAILGLRMLVMARMEVMEALGTAPDRRAAVRGPVLTGMLTSLANPYWTLWWATVGLNYVALALKRGVVGLGAFYAGHILADLVWYSFVAAAVASGRRILSPRIYVALFMLCGAALACLGGYFLGTSIVKLK
ncbi:MAG: lysine transporter LysE [Verrucomicrobia bacterium]|nr:MAG: lysine transporter LysE [Verrucomicrobiota bacterium]